MNEKRATNISFGLLEESPGSPPFQVHRVIGSAETLESIGGLGFLSLKELLLHMIASLNMSKL